MPLVQIFIGSATAVLCLAGLRNNAWLLEHTRKGRRLVDCFGTVRAVWILRGLFMAFHVFTRYVKVTFFRGTSLRPVPPGGTGKEGRWIDIHEDDLDEAQMARWVKQAAALPGWIPGRPG